MHNRRLIHSIEINVYYIIIIFKFIDSFVAWISKKADQNNSTNNYPSMSLHEWEYLSKLYFKSDKELSEFLGIDLINLWHTNPFR